MRERIFGLDFMRAVAIVMVLCSHILWIYPPDNGFVSQIFKLFGFWGVEIFFVLSGFLIGKILYQLYLKEDYNKNSVYLFLKRRWFRTLPNYYLVLILNVLIALYFGVSLIDLPWYVLFLQNLGWTMKPFFTESWSLSIEEYTYLLIPFVLLLVSNFVTFKNKSRFFVSVIGMLILFFIGTKWFYYLYTSNTTIDEWNLSLKAVVLYRVDSILLGVLAAWVSLNYPLFWKEFKYRLGFVGFLFIGFLNVGVGFFRILIDDYPFIWNVLYLPFTSLTFVLFLPLLSEWKVVPKWIFKPVTFVSLTSYSVYLLHYGVVLQLMKNLIDTTAFTLLEYHCFTAIYLVITFGSSYLLFNYFERPLMNLRDR